MPIYTLDRTQAVRMPLAACWEFFSNPRNLSRITPPAMGFDVRSELPASIHAGLMIEYRVSPLLGIPITWLTEITRVEAPNYFVDEQRVGPYRIWHHEHFFRALDADVTEVRDLVHYVPPLGPFGSLINRFAVRPQLDRIFDFRRAQLAALEKKSAPTSA